MHAYIPSHHQHVLISSLFHKNSFSLFLSEKSCLKEVGKYFPSEFLVYFFRKICLLLEKGLITLFFSENSLVVFVCIDIINNIKGHMNS